MHAGDYGMSVPEELRLKMKESSAMAKALRALDACPTHPRATPARRRRRSARRVRAEIEAPLRDLIRWGLLTY